MKIKAMDFFGFCFRDKSSCSPGLSQTHNVAEADLELRILLLLRSKHWGHRHVPSSRSVLHWSVEAGTQSFVCGRQALCPLSCTASSQSWLNEMKRELLGTSSYMGHSYVDVFTGHWKPKGLGY